MKKHWLEKIFKYLMTGFCLIFLILIIGFLVDNLRVSLNIFYFIISLITVGGFLYELGNYLYKKFPAKKLKTEENETINTTVNRTTQTTYK